MTVQVADVNAKVQRPVSVIKMAIVLEECSTKEQHFLMRFCGQKDSMQRIFVKKCFLFTVENACLIKQFGSRNYLKDIQKLQMMPDHVTLLRLQKKQLWSRLKS
jgi:hypothetical protein